MDEFNNDTNKEKTLSIKITVQKSTNQISSISVPIEKNDLILGEDGKGKLDINKIFEKAIEIAKNDTNTEWKDGEMTYSVNEKQIPNL